MTIESGGPKSKTAAFALLLFIKMFILGLQKNRGQVLLWFLLFQMDQNIVKKGVHKFGRLLFTACFDIDHFKQRIIRKAENEFSILSKCTLCGFQRMVISTEWVILRKSPVCRTRGICTKFKCTKSVPSYV